MNARLRLGILAVASAGILLFPRLTYASDPPPDHLVPPPIIGVNPSAERAAGPLEEIGRAGTLTMPLVGDLPSGLGSSSLVQSLEYYILIELPVTHRPSEWTSVPVPMRWQPGDPSDVSCGVQALGMALDGLAAKGGATAPASSSLMGSLSTNGLMYDFGTGVEELAYAARAAGFPGSFPFHDWSLEDLRGELQEGRSPVLALGTSGEGQAGHFVTLTGLSEDGQWVTYNDPTLGPQVMGVNEFMALWQAQGRSGMVAREELPPGVPDPMLPLLAGVAGMAGLLALGAQGQTRKGIGGRVDRGGAGGGKARSTSATRAATPPPPPRTPPPPPTPPRPPTPAPRVISRDERDEMRATPAPPPTPPARTPTPTPAPSSNVRPYTSAGSVRRDEENWPSAAPTRIYASPPIVTQTPYAPTSRTLLNRSEDLLPSQLGSQTRCSVPGLAGGRQVTVSGGTFIADNPYDVDDSYGPKAVLPGPWAVVSGVVDLFNTFAGPPAYGNYLNSQPPNVTASLAYRLSPTTTCLEALTISNDSHQPLKVASRLTTPIGDLDLGPSTWVLAGRTTISIGQASDCAGDHLDSVRIGSSLAASLVVSLVASFNDPSILRSIVLAIPPYESGQDSR